MRTRLATVFSTAINALKRRDACVFIEIIVHFIIRRCPVMRLMPFAVKMTMKTKIRLLIKNRKDSNQLKLLMGVPSNKDIAQIITLT